MSGRLIQLGLLSLVSSVLAQPYRGYSYEFGNSTVPISTTPLGTGSYGAPAPTEPTSSKHGHGHHGQHGTRTSYRTRKSTITRTSTVFVTLPEETPEGTPVGSTPITSAAEQAVSEAHVAPVDTPVDTPANGEGQCGGTVYVTERIPITITVTPSGYGAPASSEAIPVSSEVVPVNSEAAPVTSSPVPYEIPSSVPVATVPVATSQLVGHEVDNSPPAEYPSTEPTTSPVAVEPVYTPAPEPSTTSVVDEPVYTPAPEPSTSVVPSVPVSSSEAPVPSAAPTYAPTTPHSGSKRGLSYNDASLTECFENSGKISWAYNWGTTPDGLPSSFEYVPTMWGLKYDFPTIWAKNAQAAIDAGSTCLFSFNEPDHVDQSGLSVPDAVVAYKKHMQPFAGKARIGSPSVTDGPAPMGLDYLDRFLSACSGCTVDFVNVHWYNSVNNVQYFKDHVTKAHTMSGKPVWVTEFGTTDGSPEQIAEFLREVMEWMDAQDFVERYAYFMAAEGKLVSGANLNTVGQAYAS